MGYGVSRGNGERERRMKNEEERKEEKSRTGRSGKLVLYLLRRGELDGRSLWDDPVVWWLPVGRESRRLHTRRVTIKTLGCVASTGRPAARLHACAALYYSRCWKHDMKASVNGNYQSPIWCVLDISEFGRGTA